VFLKEIDVRMPSKTTIIEVARAARVSKSTVSRVLLGGGQVKEETKALVLNAIDRLGYERNNVASSMRTDRTWMIMLATPDIANPFWSEVARGVQDTVEQEGYSVVLANSDWDAAREQRFLSTARRNRFDAIVINPAAVSEEALLAHGAPIVILGLRDDFNALDMVGSDSYSGTMKALDHLYELGHRRIAFIRGKHRSGRGHARHRAFNDFLNHHALPADPSMVVEAPFDLAGGQRAAASLLQRPDRPSAIFAANDVLALGAMQTARELGLDIPADLSVVGMDDIYVAATAIPPLTTVAKAKYETGAWAAHFLLERLSGVSTIGPRRYVVPCHLVVRGSTAPPRAVG
jgi:DNA-binding LacI/PurR family transcriptional regulator